MRARLILSLSLLFFICVLVPSAVASPIEFTAGNPIILNIDRDAAFYLFDISVAYARTNPLLKWTVQADPSFHGQVVTLQFSHNGVEWYNLASAVIKSDGTATRNQPIDSSWAVNGRNYLRAVIKKEVSNVVVLTVNVGIGYWIIGFFVASICIIFIVWYIKKEKLIKKPLKIERIQSRICERVRGREMSLCLFLGLLVRVLFAPWTEQRWDLYLFRLSCAYVWGYGIDPVLPWNHLTSAPRSLIYSLHYSYPPVFLLILLSLFPLWLALTGYRFPAEPINLFKQGIEVANNFESYRSFIPPALPLLDFIIKLPSIMADIGIGYFLYKLTGDDPKSVKAIMVLWLLNPYVIQISAVWGEFDALCAFFAIGSLYLLWKDKPLLSAAFLSIGTMTKIFPVLFLPFILIFVYKRRGLRSSFKYLAVSVLVGGFILSSFLLFPHGLESLRYWIFPYKKLSPDMYGHNRITGLTWLVFLDLLFRWEGNLPISPLIFAPAYLWLGYLFWRSKCDFDSVVMSLASTLLLFFLSYTAMTPQLIFAVLPLLLFLILRGKFSRKLFVILYAIPLIYMYGRYNPLQFISPVIISEEWNYQPWSDMIRQLWPILFSNLTILYLSALMFPVTSLQSLVSLIRIRTQNGPSVLKPFQELFPQASGGQSVSKIDGSRRHSGHKRRSLI